MSEISDYIENDKTYELNIGKTFQNGSKISYHHFKYDFIPASIDRNQEAKVAIGDRNDVVIQVPHVDGSAQKYTQFTGNKQNCSTKECILIYDTKTHEFTLERLQTNFNLKKSRLEGSSKAQIITPRSITPTNENQNKKKKLENSLQPSNEPASKKSTNNNGNKSAKKDVSPPPIQPKSSKTDFNLSDADDTDGSEL